MDTRTQTSLRLGFVALCAAALAFLASGQGSFSTSQPSKFEIAPHPRDFVQIREGTTYTVPDDKLFVVTALGGRDTAECCSVAEWELLVSGSTVLASSRYPFLTTPSLVPVPPGLSVEGGRRIDVIGGEADEDDARAWGYLSDPLPPLEWNVVRVPYAPHPSDMVRFGTGTFFIVPEGKIFVLTGLGGVTGWNALHALRVNAQTEVSSQSNVWPPSGVQSFGRDAPSVRPVPMGFSAGPGSIMEVISSTGTDGTAWGYLANE